MPAPVTASFPAFCASLFAAFWDFSGRREDRGDVESVILAPSVCPPIFWVSERTQADRSSKLRVGSNSLWVFFVTHPVFLSPRAVLHSDYEFWSQKGLVFKSHSIIVMSKTMPVMCLEHPRCPVIVSSYS